jgi:hypothetical protein
MVNASSNLPGLSGMTTVASGSAKGDTYIVQMGTVYATSDKQAAAVATNVVRKIAAAKRSTGRGTH